MNAVDPARSAQMALIRNKDTKPELRVRKALHAAGLRYRLHDKRLPGRPDVLFTSRRLALFVNGCFFHQHLGCSRARMPKTRTDFWQEKLRRNVERDASNRSKLLDAGWSVITIWECETEKMAALEQLIHDVNAIASSKQPSTLIPNHDR